MLQLAAYLPQPNYLSFHTAAVKSGIFNFPLKTDRYSSLGKSNQLSLFHVCLHFNVS